MSDTRESSLADSVAVVGAPWAESTYYSDAEKWTFMFWDAGTPFRRLFDQMDLRSVLELSCGHGRHAERVAKMTSRLTLLDIHQVNLDYSKRRLAAHPWIKYVRSNGYSYRPVERESITAIYCYDSMVHFSPDIVASYLEDTARVLEPGGMALFHHSNYPAPMDRHYGQNPHARNHMTKDLFGSYARQAGLNVRQSEVMSWGAEQDLDCLTLVERPS